MLQHSEAWNCAHCVVTLEMSKSPRLKSYFMITMVNESFKKELKGWDLLPYRPFQEPNMKWKLSAHFSRNFEYEKKVPPPASFGDGPAHRDISPLRLTQSGRVANPLLVSHNSTFGQDLPSPWNIRIKKGSLWTGRICLQMKAENGNTIKYFLSIFYDGIVM